jgi:hypothetical protein
MERFSLKGDYYIDYYLIKWSNHFMFYYSWRLFKGKRQNSQENLTILMGISYQFRLTTAIECLLSIRIMPSIAFQLKLVGRIHSSLSLISVLTTIAGPLIFQWLWQESMAPSPGHIIGDTHFGAMMAAGHGRFQAFKKLSWLLHILTRKLACRCITAMSWVQECVWVLRRDKPGQLEPQINFQMKSCH